MVPGEEALDASELAHFRKGVQELAPFILLRLSADRAADELQVRDAALLRRFTDALTPVRDLHVGCRLDGRALTELEERPAFVDTRTDTSAIRAFVIWDESGWPPLDKGAEALATALVYALGTSHFEAFLALINAPNDSACRRLLRLAGAPSDVLALAPAVTDSDDSDVEDNTQPAEELSLPKESANDTDETLLVQTDSGAASERLVITPLYNAADLLISGTPVTITGKSPAHRRDSYTLQPEASSGGGSAQTYGGRTDLNALDRLGMLVAMTYELNRLLPDLTPPGVSGDSVS